MDYFCNLCFTFSYFTALPVPCSLLITCSDRADLLAHLCVMFSCVFVTFPNGVLIFAIFTFICSFIKFR